jgi:L-amino acid N-acyltransferase YncA
MRTLVRRTNEWDAPTMLKIYRTYVENSNSTPDEILPTIAEFVQKIDRYTYGWGWMISEIDGETAGFCLLTENSYDPENMFTADIQLFVNENMLRRGVGNSLYSMMLDVMEYGNKKTVYARIPLPNESAVSFHKHWGFTEKELIPAAMTKNGKAFDVLVMEKKLSPVDPQAKKPTKPFLIDSSDYEKARLKAGSLIKEI